MVSKSVGEPQLKKQKTSEVKRDFIILMAVLSALILAFVFLFRPTSKREVGTYWIEKGSGKGPYVIKGESRKESERLRKGLPATSADEMQIKYSTASFKVLYSTYRGESGNIMPVFEMESVKDQP